jgi:hypothetical protein
VTSSRALAVLLLIGTFIAGAAPLARPQAITMEGYPAVGAPAAVKLLAPGAEPRKALRYTLAANTKSRVDMAMNLTMAMSVAGMSMPMNFPGMKMTLDVGVTSVAPNGDFTYDMAFTGLTLDAGADANPMLAGALQTLQSGITSIKGTSTASSRGVTLSTKLAIADPQMQQTLGQMTSEIENLSMPFPEEAVGVGARWEVRRAASSGGQTTFQKTTYEVVSIAGTTVTLAVKGEMTAPPQAISNAALPAGAEMYLEKLTGTGEGTVVVRLDALVPTSELTQTSSMAMTMSMGGQTQPITADNTVKITIAPVK